MGLFVIFPDGSTQTLIRFNGSSHIHPNRIENTQIEWQTHIHIATERYIQIGSKAEGYAEVTTAYKCVNGALQYAVKYCNISSLINTSNTLDLFHDA